MQKYSIQGLIIRNLYSSDGKNFSAIMRECYTRIISTLEVGRVVSQQSRSIVTALLLFAAERAVPAGTMFKEFWEAVSESREAKAIYANARQNWINRRYEQTLTAIMEEMSDVNQRFISALLRLMQGDNAAEESFRIAAGQVESQGGQIVVDVIFRLLALAGYTSIVIMLDEMEAVLSPRTPDARAQILTNLTNLHDKFGQAGQEVPEGYPGVALYIFAPPSLVEDMVRESGKPFYSRYFNFRETLNPPRDSEIEDYIQNLFSLYSQAFDLRDGYRLNVAEIRQRIIDDIGKKRPVVPAEWRYIVQLAVEIANREWRKPR